MRALERGGGGGGIDTIDASRSGAGSIRRRRGPRRGRGNSKAPAGAQEPGPRLGTARARTPPRVHPSNDPPDEHGSIHGPVDVDVDVDGTSQRAAFQVTVVRKTR
jgi:hypothetical protein